MVSEQDQYPIGLLVYQDASVITHIQFEGFKDPSPVSLALRRMLPTMLAVDSTSVHDSSLLQALSVQSEMEWLVLSQFIV